MSKPVFEAFIVIFGAVFVIFFAVVVAPPALESGDIMGAFAAGFVNPYSSGYSLDAILTGFILIAWVLYERRTLGIRHGWVAIVLCFVPGVAAALAYYLILRTRTRAVPTADTQHKS